MKRRVLYSTILILLVLIGVWAWNYFDFAKYFRAENEVASSAEQVFEPSLEFEKSKEIIEQAEAQADQGIFTHPTLGFTFSYPKEYKVGGFVEDAATQTILVQPKDESAAGLPDNAGFQIYINPFDEDIELDPARILQDIPDLKIAAPQKVALDGVNGVAFISDNPAFGGKSREIWIVHGGYIYQISSYLEFSPWLEQIVGTWKW